MQRLVSVLGALALLLVAPSLPAAPGLSFLETMPGWLTPGTDRTSRGPGAQKAALKLKIQTEDADAFFADPSHPMRLQGELEIRSPDGERLSYPIEEGRFLFLAPGTSPDARIMEYRFAFHDAAGRRFGFVGRKFLRDESGFDAVKDTTTLFCTLHRGGPDGPAVGAGRLRFEVEKPWVMAKFVTSFRVPGATSLRERISVFRRFLRLYLGTLAELYL